MKNYCRPLWSGHILENQPKFKPGKCRKPGNFSDRLCFTVLAETSSPRIPIDLVTHPAGSLLSSSPHSAHSPLRALQPMVAPVHLHLRLLLQLPPQHRESEQCSCIDLPLTPASPPTNDYDCPCPSASAPTTAAAAAVQRELSRYVCRLNTPITLHSVVKCNYTY